jgi:hypothetical protein
MEGRRGLAWRLDPGRLPHVLRQINRPVPKPPNGFARDRDQRNFVGDEGACRDCPGPAGILLVKGHHTSWGKLVLGRSHAGQGHTQKKKKKKPPSFPRKGSIEHESGQATRSEKDFSQKALSLPSPLLTHPYTMAARPHFFCGWQLQPHPQDDEPK